MSYLCQFYKNHICVNYVSFIKVECKNNSSLNINTFLKLCYELEELVSFIFVGSSASATLPCLNFKLIFFL